MFSIIEAAHSSLLRDHEDKLAIYAAAGVSQYLIVNLNNNTIEIFEDPDRTSEQYRTKTTADRSERVHLKVGDDEVFEFDARDILP